MKNQFKNTASSDQVVSYSLQVRVLGNGISYVTILLKKKQENSFVWKVSEIGTDYHYRRYFLKMYRYRYCRYIFFKLSVSILSLL